ncbi:box C/D snoRNA protein 1 isoform X2 [Centruroides vittatus]|uniref:box C/D snoRNA protein 1 isoform X2 n=1 Tax=Centruroides vittatus TaxID=120091 RepID=UPI00351028D2
MALRSKCNQCNAPSKYRCPRCHFLSCSVQCVNAHKKEYSCNGIREKTAFIQMKNFSDMDLLSDYRFLEETSRIIDNASRDKVKHNSNKGILSMKLQNLRKQARKRGTTLRIQPPLFTRRISNTSYYSVQENLIFWKVNWVFSDTNAIYNDTIPETTVINTALEKYLNPEYPSGDFSEEIKRQLIMYQAAGHNGIKALYYKENEKRYYELDKSQTLEVNLRGKSIVEFPTIHIILASSSCAYNIVEID